MRKTWQAHGNRFVHTRTYTSAPATVKKQYCFQFLESLLCLFVEALRNQRLRFIRMGNWYKARTEQWGTQVPSASSVLPHAHKNRGTKLTNRNTRTAAPAEHNECKLKPFSKSSEIIPAA